MRTPRSYLFVPGHRPELFAKAAASGADAIILDLEDAVGPGLKDSALDSVAGHVRHGARAVVRVNGMDSPWFDADLDALTGTGCAAVMVPKATPASLQAVADRLPGTPLIALIETAEGLATVRESVTMAGVSRLAFGNLDFAADLRIPDTSAILDPARFELVLASRLGGLAQPVDGVTQDFRDAALVEADARRARTLGFGAKLCIHPAQVAATNASFLPTDSEVDRAQRIIAALEASGNSVVAVDGKMVDRPVIDWAHQIMRQREVV